MRQTHDCHRDKAGDQCTIDVFLWFPKRLPVQGADAWKDNDWKEVTRWLEHASIEQVYVSNESYTYWRNVAWADI